MTMTSQYRSKGDAAVGMMDAAYFVGRRELLEFFNDLLDLNLAKIEETASGAVACQLTELVFPNSIPMSKVNWGARSDFEYVHNYKLLQKGFDKHNVQRHVDVGKLIRAKYQDNLEFCQWLKAFYDQSGVYREDYDPVAVRNRGKGGKLFNDAINKKRGGVGGAGRRGATNKPVQGRPRPAGGVNKPTATAAAAAAASPQPPSSTLRSSKPLCERASPSNNIAGSPNKDASSAAAAAAAAETAALATKNAELEEHVAEMLPKITELEDAVVATERERDFYFDKLRYVEVMLQVHQERQGADDGDNVTSGSETSSTSALLENIFKVLYASPEDQLMVDEDGVIVEGGVAEELHVDVA